MRACGVPSPAPDHHPPTPQEGDEPEEGDADEGDEGEDEDEEGEEEVPVRVVRRSVCAETRR